MTEIGGWWYMEKNQRVCHHLGNRIKLKQHKKKMIELNINYTILIGIGMIGNSNYIGTSLSGLIQEGKLK